MSIPVSSSTTSSTLAASSPASAAAAVKPGQDGSRARETAPASATASATAQARANYNSAIVSASLSVALKAGDEPLALLYKSAITSINEELKADFGDDAIQKAAGIDFTPEATAARIVSLSTGFYGAYLDQKGAADDAATRTAFVDTIRSGVERGFKEARTILEGLKVLGGEIAAGIDRTYELVQKGLDEFAAKT